MLPEFCGKFLSATLPRKADVSSIDLDQVYEASTDVKAVSRRSSESWSEWKLEFAPLSIKKMPPKPGFGRRDCKSPGPGGGWFRSRERIRCVPFDPAYAALTVVAAPTCRWRVKFHCCRYPVEMSGLSVFGEVGGVTPPAVGNGLLNVS